MKLQPKHHLCFLPHRTCSVYNFSSWFDHARILTIHNMLLARWLSAAIASFQTPHQPLRKFQLCPLINQRRQAFESRDQHIEAHTLYIFSLLK
ncbi:unnamed protein product [Cuscuta campestris]|uniref:Uncharacterized protein n=1 Tax=Cuscuta campestris TaxID=132261 RepID=A0A484N048_9ASTE|nr:unnamed protein product [Cuscuta campestris]